MQKNCLQICSYTEYTVSTSTEEYHSILSKEVKLGEYPYY